MRFFQTRRLRTLFFFHETTWSGAPIQLLHLLVWLHSKGWPVAAAVPEHDTPEAGPLSMHLTDLGIEVLPVLNLASPPDLLALGKLCERFEVVVANTLVMWAAVRAAYESNVACVWYIHESLIARHLIELNPEITHTLPLPQFLLMPTQRTASLYLNYVNRPIKVLPYGIPPIRLSTPIHKNSRVTCLLLGSYETRKGQDVFIKAIRQLSAQPRNAALFRMAGRDLDPEYFDQLRELAAGLSNVELGPALSHEESGQALAAADVVVCASRDETMPLVLLEAMSLGKAIVTTQVGGIAEWLRHSVNALLVRPEDPAELASALQRCLAEPKLRAKMGREAKRTFHRSFSLDRLGRSFRRLLDEACRIRHL